MCFLLEIAWRECEWVGNLFMETVKFYMLVNLRKRVNVYSMKLVMKFQL